MTNQEYDIQLEKQLKQIIPFKFRVWPWNKAKTKYQVLWYIDARDAADRLDQVVWPTLWSRDHKEVAGKVYGGLGIYMGDVRVRKRDCGTESNIDAEKGEASDSFKRACVNWGLGRFLYTLPTFWITKEEKDKNQYNMTEYIKTKYKSQLKQRAEKFNLSLAKIWSSTK